MGKLKEILKGVSQAERDKAHAAGNSLPDKSYPINNTHQLHSAAVLAASGHGDAAAAKRLIRRRAKELGVDVNSLPGFGSKTEKSEFDVTVPLWKNDAKQIVYGVVLTPGVRDSQGDIVSADEIEKAAHKFLVQYRKHDVQHSEELAGVETVESFIAPADMEVAGQQVLKGSWVMATHVSDPDTWERVCKKELGGYSIGGTGERIAEAAGRP